uniref:Uncharacterized protein n=1 Tax=Siphoviridae sp. ctMAv2 TaxID=2826258 RepID=A0A8S5LSD3_9CAUD|nr:MAG TPA: hypothetical protein [Siphoviridae sp. ctMAv2]
MNLSLEHLTQMIQTWSLQFQPQLMLGLSEYHVVC